MIVMMVVCFSSLQSVKQKISLHYAPPIPPTSYCPYHRGMIPLPEPHRIVQKHARLARGD
jgi:hypothetical protein